ncbi:MAG: hypothetical protein GY841_00100 [FCB group bacterium]|nr:hypothetical protein [FCB group bacterium]
MSFLPNVQAGEITRALAENQQVLDPIRQLIFDNFGQNGLYAAYLLVAAIGALIVFKLIKTCFEIIFFVALPSVLSAFVLTFFLPYSFFYLLPATTALFTLGLVLRTVTFSKG